jgi:HAD superfamily hydrolase (TIGR01509 family)
MPTLPDAVLFDADGVLQRATIDWRTTLGGYAGPAGTPDEFILDVMTSEGPSLIGAGDFLDALTEVLARWESQATADQVLELWHQFEHEPEVVELIQTLRTAGVACHLATNQHAYRRRIMHDERRYADWFDHTFYSCDLGVAKPDPKYFRAILDKIGLPPESVLFIDDNHDNIAGARSVGLQAEHYDLDSGTETLRTLLRTYNLLTP